MSMMEIFYSKKRENRISNCLSSKHIKNIEKSTFLMCFNVYCWRLYYLKLISPYDYLKNYLFASIKETTCNGIKCYRFTNLYNYQAGNNDYIYISKDNGLPIRCSVQSSDSYNEMREFSFEFDKLTEKDILELVDF